MSERLLFLLWQTSWQGALFAVVVGVLCRVFRIPAPFRALLWLLVGLKFLGGFLWLLGSGPGIHLFVTVPLAMPAVNTPQDPIVLSWVIPTILSFWVIGVLLGTGFVYRRARINYQTVCSAIPSVDPKLTIEVKGLAEQIGITPTHIPEVRVIASETAGPQVTLFGMKPVVVLPTPLLPPSQSALNPMDLRFIFAHELAHVRRGDLWAGLAFAAAHTLFFFHPCVAWAKQEWEAAREEACDLMALQACSKGDRDTAARYGALLLRLGSGLTISNESSAAMASSPFGALRRRLTHLSAYQTKGSRLNPAQLIIGLPCVVLLLLPLDVKWIAPATMPIRSLSAAPRPQHRRSIVSRDLPSRNHVTLAPTMTSRPVVEKRVRLLPTRLVAVEQPASASIHLPASGLKPVETATPKSEPVDSSTKQSMLLPSNPVTIADANPLTTSASEAITRPDMVPPPAVVEPAVVPDSPSSYSSTPTLSESTMTSGAVTASRRPETVLGRLSLKGLVPHSADTARTVPSPDSARPTVPFPTILPSPVPSPNPSDKPVRDGDAPHPLEQ